MTYGETIEDARKMAKEAIELYVETLQAHGDDIPVEDDLLEAAIAVETDA